MMMTRPAFLHEREGEREVTQVSPSSSALPGHQSLPPPHTQSLLQALRGEKPLSWTRTEKDLRNGPGESGPARSACVGGSHCIEVIT